jgi:hypothetical protein
MESVFTANPKVDILYVFEDGNAFISKRDAENYAHQTKQLFATVERKEKEVKPKNEKQK